MTRFQQTRLNIGITVLFLVLAVAAAVTIRIFYTKDWGIVLFFPMLVSFAFFRRNSRHSKRMPDSASTAKPDESAGPDGRQLAEREQLQQAEKLRHAIMSIGSTLDMREVKERILISLKTLLPCREASLRLFRGGVVDEDGLNGILPRLQERGRPIMETRQDAVCLYLPVYTEHRLRGVMTLRHDRPYLQHEVSLAFTYASQVGIFLENAELYQRMQKMATTDALTGICNRGHFFERAEQKFAEAARNGRHLGAILFDIDHFKKVNDRHGHPAGDRVLASSARLVRSMLEDDERFLFARYGGEEFVILAEGAGNEPVLELAERIRDGISQLSFSSDHGEFKITASLGVSFRDHRTDTLEKLLKEADDALYRAKEEGRNRWCMA